MPYHLKNRLCGAPARAESKDTHGAVRTRVRIGKRRVPVFPRALPVLTGASLPRVARKGRGAGRARRGRCLARHPG